MKNKKLSIYIASDHGGFELKEKIKKYLERKRYKVKDFGAYEFNPKDDYPDFVIPLAKEIVKNKIKVRGIVIGGAGIGECIAANKIKGIKAMLYHGKNLDIVKIGREHDNVNVLCFGAWFVNEKEARKAIDIFLNTKFKAGRHVRRLRKIEKIER